MPEGVVYIARREIESHARDKSCARLRQMAFVRRKRMRLIRGVSRCARVLVMRMFCFISVVFRSLD